MDRRFKNAGSFVSLLGRNLEVCPEKYQLFSPVAE